MSDIPKTGWAISEYHDTAAVYAQLRQLTSQPVRGLKQAALEEYLAYYDRECGKSKGVIEEAQEYIPGGVQHNLAFNYPFPMAIKKAEGAYV